MKIVQNNHCIGLYKEKRGRSTFLPLTNFGLRLLKHVRSPAELSNYSGFVVEVTQKQQRTSADSHHVAKG